MLTEKDHKEFASLVKRMREVPKVKSETFPTRYRCYVPMDLVREVDKYVRRWRYENIQ